MKIYILDSDDENYGYFDYASDSDEDCGISADYDSFRGQSMKEFWTVPKLVKSKLIPKKKREKIEFGDINSTAKAPKFSKKGKDCLFEILKDLGEFLLAETEAGDYYYYNVMLLLDVL